MKNKKMFYSIIGIFLLIVTLIFIFLFKDKIVLDFSIEELRRVIESNQFSELIFIGIWTLRLILFIPGVTLMLLGGIIFEPSKAFLLSMVGIVASDVLVFLLAKSKLLDGIRNKLINKYSDMIGLIEEYSYKILAVGVLCPVAPTDVIVFVSSYMGINFKKFVLIFSLANIPAIYLYSYLGDSFNGSIINTIMIIVTLIITGFFSYRLWKKMRCNLAKEN